MKPYSCLIYKVRDLTHMSDDFTTAAVGLLVLDYRRSKTGAINPTYEHHKTSGKAGTIEDGSHHNHGLRTSLNPGNGYAGPGPECQRVQSQF